MTSLREPEAVVSGNIIKRKEFHDGMCGILPRAPSLILEHLQPLFGLLQSTRSPND